MLWSCSLPLLHLLFTAAATGPVGPVAADQPAWAAAEKGILEDHVQLTPSARFRKAGECYFSPDGRRIIFQAIERKDDPAREEAFYQMYVADLVTTGGRLTGIDHIRQLSPPGSSNTCGWFHPTEPDVVVFGSTRVVPKNPDKTGYQRGSSRYSWQFPEEMDVVRCDLRQADGTARTLIPLVEDPHAYLAECVVRNDGRYLVYCRRVISEGTAGGDLVIMDLADGRKVSVTGNAGYDGGPFFSPEGRRLCYRSDRRGDDLLQIFVAELAFDRAGNILGVEREFQLTDNDQVNWAPFWHPAGRHLIYTSSEMGHDNYEVFLFDADAGDGDRPTRYGTRKRRLTFAPGFDGLPVFNADASLMMWTSQRSGDGTSQVWAARFVLPLADAPAPELPVEATASVPAVPKAQPERSADDPNRLQVKDPDTGLIYLYDMASHKLSVYDPQSHVVREVTDQAEIGKALRLFGK